MKDNEIRILLDKTIPKLMRLEKEIGIIEFLNNCIEIYNDRGNGGWEYDIARDEFLNKMNRLRG